MRPRMKRSFNVNWPLGHMVNWKPIAAGLCLSIAVGGCAPVRNLILDEPPPRTVLSAGFRNLSERYIKPVDMHGITLAGLKSVAAMDPDVEVAEADGALLLRIRQAVAEEWRQPLDADYASWARFSAQFLDLLRKHSTIVRGRSNEDVYSAIFKGAMTDLDRYSRYASAAAARQRQAARDGFGGLGITIKYHGGETEILEVHEDTPAARAGLKENDVITHVDDRPVRDLGQSAVVALLRGPIDSHVRLTIRRNGRDNPVFATVTRDLIMIPTVKARTEDGILILKISGFNVGTAKSVRESVQDARRRLGRGLKGIVLDLRGNPGGLLKQAVRVGDLFLDGGPIISARGRHRLSYQVFEASRGDISDGRPLAVLVNGRSASSAEIVAAALHDRGRAVVLGSSSYGKGTVQTILRLPNGGEMTITWAKLYTPAGNALQSRGVVPAICTNGTGKTARGLREAILSGAWREDYDRIARLQAANAPEGSYRALRADCPPDSGKPSVDLNIARLIIERQGIYNEILSAGRPPLTADRRAPSD